MKEIEFHFNVPDKLAYSCRLLRKAYRAGGRAVVTAEPALLQQLDRMLWMFSPTGFLPHCMDDACDTTRAATPVVLAARLDRCDPASVLINLGHSVPDRFTRFERFIELVSAQQDDRELGRGRWKLYKEQGYVLSRHDAAAPKDTTA